MRWSRPHEMAASIPTEFSVTRLVRGSAFRVAPPAPRSNILASSFCRTLVPTGAALETLLRVIEEDHR